MTLPKVIRDRLGVGPGDQLEFIEERGRYVIKKTPRESPFDRHLGSLTHLAGMLPDDLVRDMRGHE